MTAYFSQLLSIRLSTNQIFYLDYIVQNNKNVDDRTHAMRIAIQRYINEEIKKCPELKSYVDTKLKSYRTQKTEK